MVSVGRAREAQSREERLVAIGQLLSSVMHDLRQPLTVISGYAQLMANEPDAAERHKSCELVLKQFGEIGAMTREVLEFARGKVQVLRRKVLVNVFMDEVADHLRKDFAGKGVELVTRAHYPGAARFDAVKMKRVIFNIARNAAQAMPGGGRFTLRVARQEDRLVFRMSDNGPGIPEEMRGRLFESFATHGKADGTGLGLAIVKRIAEEHGGSVECRTRPGKGTTFIVSIPA
jgi:signal transduction histidine kinase